MTKLNKKDYEFKMSHLSLKIVKMDEIGETRKKIKIRQNENRQN